MKFTHLHVHSHYSLLDGLAKIDDLVARAKALGMESLALTDHGTLYGAVEFFQKAKKAGLKPIVGCEIYLTNNKMSEKRPDDKRFHLTLLIKNKTGYGNLVQLITKAHLEGFYYKPRVDKDCLKEHAEGLICLSGCSNSEISHLIYSNQPEAAKNAALEYRDIFGKENFYIELQPHFELDRSKKIYPKLLELAREVEAPIVATNDAHYLAKEDDDYQDVLLAIGTGNKVSDPNRLTMKGVNLSLRSAQDMEELFKDLPEAIENTQKIADACNFEFEFGTMQLPHFELPEGKTIEGYLKELAHEGLKKLFGYTLEEAPEAIRERFLFELSVIKRTGFPSYILIVQDFVNWAKERGIVVGPGRGSAAGSLISYLIGITNIDPIKYNLLFERFLNPDRIAPPDIDLDFADHRRDEVIEYVAQKYGRDHVAQIITFGTMAARAAVRDAGRALGFSYTFCDRVAKMIPFAVGMTFAKALEISDELKQVMDTDPQARQLIQTAQKLEGVARHASTHACGVVITKNPITHYMPIQWAAQSNARAKGQGQALVTQYDMKAVEALGLLKMDFLGLRNLTIIEKALELIEKNYGQRIDIYNIPLDDKDTFGLLARADTTGVFQFESKGMRRYLKELRPNALEDLIVMVAAFRPGPMEFIPTYIARKHGKEKVNYLHPKLAPILESTYGVAIYQEQVLKIANQLAGFTIGEADILRKAVGKKIKKLLDEQREKMIIGMINNGIDKITAEKIWDFIEPFARYGFNRSHAACYALIAYQTAYLKTRYPGEFMTALLNTESFDIDRVAELIEETKRMGIDVSPPDINESARYFTLIQDEFGKRIRFGLGAIKNLGENAVSAIMKELEVGRFTELQSFLERVPAKDLNKKSLESLIKCGALDAYGDRKTLYDNIEELLRYSKDWSRSKESPQGGLFGANISVAPLRIKPTESATKKEKLGWEKELLGLYISDHPLKEYQQLLEKNAVLINNIKPALDGKRINVGGVISSVQKFVTKAHQLMLFVKIEDWLANIEVIVFPSVLEKTANLWQENSMVMIQGRVSNRDGNLKIICDTVQELKAESRI